MSVFFGPLLKGTCRLLFPTHWWWISDAALHGAGALQGWKQHSYTVPPWARWAAPHGTHREHHSWENTVKLPNASPTLVLSTRDSTLAACSYWNSQGRACMDTSAACCGFCAMKLLGSHVQWLSAREEGLPLAHLGTKMTEDWTVSCL